MLLLKEQKPLFEGANWDFNALQRVHAAVEEIALGELGLDVYPNQIEVITSEQMLDAYASVGLPLMYRHWSFGKRFAHHETLYRKGLQGLAYEIVINSSPCISYIMEENSMTMQTLVIAHAAFGHNHFFKNNYLFRQWTDAEGILDYLTFARDYTAKFTSMPALAMASFRVAASAAASSPSTITLPSSSWRRATSFCWASAAASARAWGVPMRRRDGPVFWGTSRPTFARRAAAHEASRKAVTHHQGLPRHFGPA